MYVTTSADRDGALAVYQILKRQIERFETTFYELNGCRPKGEEKAPIANTYAQYRVWKRILRGDAATRIQALIRGASVRQRIRLLRSMHQQYSTTTSGAQNRGAVVLTPEYNAIRGYNPDYGQTSLTTHSVREDRYRPMEVSIDSEYSPEQIPRRLFHHEDDQEVPFDQEKDSYDYSPEQIPRQLFTEEDTYDQEDAYFDEDAYQKRNFNHDTNTFDSSHRRTNSFNHDRYTIDSPYQRTSSLPSSSSPMASSNLGTYGDLARLSLRELQERKKRIKRQLVKYDKLFLREHGRAPLHDEKEPIRHLYEHYNALKDHINYKMLFARFEC